jgi:hypothetical protein
MILVDDGILDFCTIGSGAYIVVVAVIIINPVLCRVMAQAAKL